MMLRMRRTLRNTPSSFVLVVVVSPSSEAYLDGRFTNLNFLSILQPEQHESQCSLRSIEDQEQVLKSSRRLNGESICRVELDIDIEFSRREGVNRLFPKSVLKNKSLENVHEWMFKSFFKMELHC